MKQQVTVAFALVLALLIVASTGSSAEPPEGVLPTGADGKPLNLDFETGTLKDWTAEGQAFANQPIKGDTVYPRRRDNRSQHQGDWWIGGFERHGDKPQGTLTSVAFRVTHPWASFLVGGGPHEVTSVELVRKESSQVFLRALGLEEENLRRVVVDLKPHLDKEIFIRLVDRHSGHWGHVNFDDFRFHSQKPNFPERPKPVQPDVLKYAGLPPQKAAEAMTVPEGFTVQLFAGEPDVHQPVAMCLDDQGRVWVAEAYVYPRRLPPLGAVLPDEQRKQGDRILIFEDADGDGKFDKRTVFMEGLNLVSGLEVGFGGVWIGAAPYLLFVPVKDGEDRPAGPPKVLLDGWGWQDTHETLNAFLWGPDGWLYGCHGVFTHSRVGKPGTPDAERVPINAGIWRYHPTRHLFEVFAHGTSNPWGFDFDDWGQAFCEACVIPHCFHIIPGARYHRQAGSHFNPYTYDDIKTIADHFHYVGATPHGGNNRSDSAGGGHAHCGTMVYLGGTWPADYRNRMFMGNIHGRRINVDILKPKGSGYVASHGPDFLLANDAWARFINLRYGPDGNVYLIDWYDKQACHTGDVKIWDRTNGRIYKVSHRGAKPVRVDLGRKTDAELVELQLHPNDWYVRHARRLLQERYHARTLDSKAVNAALERIAFEHADETRRLRGLWALRAVNSALSAEWERKGLEDKSPHVRAWTIRLLSQNDTTVSWVHQAPRLLTLAEKDPSPVVRLALASALQRLGPSLRWEFLDRLVRHAEDAGDHNLPLMYWYAAEPMAELDPARALTLASRSQVPHLLPFMVRRIGSSGAPEAVRLLVAAMAKSDDPAVQRTFLRALAEALKGRRQVAMPAEWPAVFGQLVRSKDAEVRNQATTLAVTFGDPRASDELRRVLTAATGDVGLRLQALVALVSNRDPQLPPLLHKLLSDPALRGPALRGLAAFDDPKTPAAILEVYGSLTSEEKRDALGTLASRAAYGKALLEALATRKIAASEVPAEIVRQLRNLQDKAIDQRIADVWGIVRATAADRVKLMTQYRQMLHAQVTPPDLALGRATFAKACAQCHTLFGTGGKVGPDITGSNRSNLDYLLENMLDPSAVIPKEYAATVVALKSGRVVTGIVRNETPAAVTVLTANETVTLPRDEIESRTASSTSMMPDDLFKPLQNEEIRALIAYLQSPAQVPMLATADNVKDFFNGKDLAGWDGDPKLWQVEDGQIVGRSPGLKRNEFLRSQMLAGDFRLTLQVRLVPNAGNSGVQFRSEALPGGEVKGLQADVGEGWWGKIYEEHGRGLLWNKPGDALVKSGEWNQYEIVAVGSRIRTFLNGKPCAELDDSAVARRGIFALQLHSGGPLEVRYKDLKLEVLPTSIVPPQK